MYNGRCIACKRDLLICMFLVVCQVDLRSNELGPEGGKAIAKGIADSRSLA